MAITYICIYNIYMAITDIYIYLVPYWWTLNCVYIYSLVDGPKVAAASSPSSSTSPSLILVNPEIISIPIRRLLLGVRMYSYLAESICESL